jgi:hypothetical protein
VVEAARVVAARVEAVGVGGAREVGISLLFQLLFPEVVEVGPTWEVKIINWQAV